ncbi:MAG TPA: hypothetical protein GXZ46_06785 [Actinomycetales bacterium]|nr:hypothetical protein [Actinomycetales bacterium]
MTDYKTALRALLVADQLPAHAGRIITGLRELGIDVLGWRAAEKYGGCEPEDMLTDEYLSLHSRPPIAESLHSLTVVSRGPDVPDREVTAAVAAGLGETPWMGTTTRIADGDAEAAALGDVEGVAVDMDADGRVCGIRFAGSGS